MKSLKVYHPFGCRLRAKVLDAKPIADPVDLNQNATDWVALACLTNLP